MPEPSNSHESDVDKEELTAFLNELLEAERAGARVALESARAAETSDLRGLLTMIQKDEARWCAMLASHIKSLGVRPTTQTGAFYGKAMAIADLRDRIVFLNRGQGWVVRKLREMLPRLHDEQLHADLAEMLRSHEVNIARANEVVK